MGIDCFYPLPGGIFLHRGEGSAAFNLMRFRAVGSGRGTPLWHSVSAQRAGHALALLVVRRIGDPVLRLLGGQCGTVADVLDGFDPDVRGNSTADHEAATVTPSESPSLPTAAPSPRRFIRLPDVLQRTGMSKSTLYRKINAGEFPAFLKLGERTTVWVEHEVAAWMQACITDRWATPNGSRQQAAA